MTYRMILRKYVGKKLKPGEPSDFYWTLRPDSAFWHYYYLEILPSTAIERHFMTTVYFDENRVITGIDDLNSEKLLVESHRYSEFGSGRKPRSEDYEALDEQLENCIE